VSVTASGDLDAFVSALAELDEVDEAGGSGPGTVRIVLHERTGMVPIIVSTAEHLGVEITDLTISSATLETVFIQLTGRDLRE
jgi:ABC-2 type transport system ATP-binding protein